MKNVDFIPQWSIKLISNYILYLAKSLVNVSFPFVNIELNVLTYLPAQWTAFVSRFGPIPISILPLSVVKALDRYGSKLKPFCIFPVLG